MREIETKFKKEILILLVTNERLYPCPIELAIHQYIQGDTHKMGKNNNKMRKNNNKMGKNNLKMGKNNLKMGI